MTKNCENCNEPFEAKRKTAKFCSNACKLKAARETGVNPDTGEVLELDYKRDEAPKIAEPIKKPYDREKALAGFIKMGLSPVTWITTGIPEFDELTQIPRGRITQIQGPFSTGKTTLCLNMVKGLKNKKVLYIDSEASLNPELILDMELDPKNLKIWNESAFIEDMYEELKKGAESGKYELIILDSLAGCTTKTEEEGEISASNIGQKAKMVNKMMRILPSILKNTDTALVIINQEREFIGGYVPTVYTPGGKGPMYHASLIIQLKSVKSWRFPEKPKDGVYSGQFVEATILKSKVNTPGRKKKFKLYYPNPVAQEPEHTKSGEF